MSSVEPGSQPDSSSLDSPDEEHSTSIRDVKQLGFFAAVANLGYVFWVVGGIGFLTALGIWIYGRGVLTLKTTD